MGKLRGLTHSRSVFTSGAEQIISHLTSWNWSSILTKANLLVMLYWTLSIGVAKMTYVFLSWLNQTLLAVDFLVVLLIFFAVGWTMFLLPPVPGIPVYVTSGIVIPARARSTPVGFWGGVVIAVVESFILKLVAVCGQYMIGFYMGKSVKIQQQVAVDKVFTRAIEKILKTSGLNLPKVAVLVGGPDWPTSVLCGILRLNLLQCVIGTMPVILVSTPCVLAGAFMTGPEEPKEVTAQPGTSTASDTGIWSTLYSAMLAFSAIGQMASGVLALYFIQEYVHRYGKELAVHRPEHEPVAALTRQEAEYEQALIHVTDLRVLPASYTGLLGASSGMLLCSLFIFMFMDEACFRPFEVKNRICADFAESGLGCNVLNLVKGPGWIVLAIFFIGCLVHVIYGKITENSALSYVAERQRLTAVTDPQEERRRSLTDSAASGGSSSSWPDSSFD